MKLASQIMSPLVALMIAACTTSGDDQHRASIDGHPSQRGAAPLNINLFTEEGAPTRNQLAASATAERCFVDIRNVQRAPAHHNNVVFLSRPAGDTMFIDVLNIGEITKQIYSREDALIATLPANDMGTLKFTASGKGLVFTGDNVAADPKPISIKNVGAYDSEVLPRYIEMLGGPPGKSVFSFGISGLMSGFTLVQVVAQPAQNAGAGDRDVKATAELNHSALVTADRCIIDIHPVQPPPSASNDNNLVIVSIARDDTLTLYAWSLGAQIKSLSEHDKTPIGQIVNGQLAVLTFTASGDKLKLAATGLKAPKTIDPYPSAGHYDPTIEDDHVKNLQGPDRVAVLSFGIHGFESVLRVTTSATPP